MADPSDPRFSGGQICPTGMTLVAPPTRSSVYTLRTGNDGPDLQVVSNTQVSGGSTDPTSYVPGELMPLYLKVVQKMIQRMEDAGRPNGWESSAHWPPTIRRQDGRPNRGEGRLVGDTARGAGALLDARRRAGCSGKALMHRYAEPKHFLEIVRFRAPPAGTGAITFRCLIKQGDTNGGAFYYPLSKSDTPTLLPAIGRPQGDLVLAEGSPPATPLPWIYRGEEGESCTTACARSNLRCDETRLNAAASADALQTAVEDTGFFLCTFPYLSTCTDAAPRMSGLGDGLCWYRHNTCPPRASSACDAVPTGFMDTSLRLCPCIPFIGGRRQLDDDASSNRLDPLNPLAPELNAHGGVSRPFLTTLLCHRLLVLLLRTPHHQQPQAPLTNDPREGGGNEELQRLRRQQAVEAEEARLEREDLHQRSPEDALNDFTQGTVITSSHDASPPCDDENETKQPRAAAVGHGKGGNPSLCPNARRRAAAIADDAQAATEGTRSFASRIIAHGRTLLGSLCVLAVGLVILAARSRKAGGRRGGGNVGLVLSLMASSGSAHNWLRSIRSRARNRASTMSPCRARTQFAYPSIQVNANSTFVMEWATGHGGFTEFVMIRADAERYLPRVPRILNRYERDAPQSAHMYEGDFWGTNHLGSINPSTIHPNCNANPRYCTCKVITSSSPEYVNRPWGHGPRDRLAYHPHIRTRDKRIAYRHPRYPWLIAYHKFQIQFHYPRSADTAHFRFPPHTPPGQYVIYYMWGGYRDCVDVDILPITSPCRRQLEASTDTSLVVFRPTLSSTIIVNTLQALTPSPPSTRHARMSLPGRRRASRFHPTACATARARRQTRRSPPARTVARTLEPSSSLRYDMLLPYSSWGGRQSEGRAPLLMSYPCSRRLGLHLPTSRTSLGV